MAAWCDWISWTVAASPWLRCEWSRPICEQSRARRIRNVQPRQRSLSRVRIEFSPIISNIKFKFIFYFLFFWERFKCLHRGEARWLWTRKSFVATRVNLQCRSSRIWRGIRADRSRSQPPGSSRPLPRTRRAARSTWAHRSATRTCPVAPNRNRDSTRRRMARRCRLCDRIKIVLQINLK